MDYAVKLPVFEGPLDLLLHLIKKHEIDISDIPIAIITEQYLKYLDMMHSLNLNVAGEFLVMTSTLTYIKSRMLLPVAPEEDGDGEDPRQALVLQLLEYQKFKKKAQELEALAQRRKLLFSRRHPPRPENTSTVLALPKLGVYSIWQAFKYALGNIPKETAYQLGQQKGLSLEEEITNILAKLEEYKKITLGLLFKEASSRLDLVIIFVALLELARRQLIRLYQSQPFGEVWISSAR